MAYFIESLDLLSHSILIIVGFECLAKVFASEKLVDLESMTDFIEVLSVSNWYSLMDH